MKISPNSRKKAKENDFKLKKLRNSPYEPVSSIHSYYIQELTNLKVGRKNSDSVRDEWGWGGGYSGLTTSTLKALNKLFCFRYMGASEYERGDVGRSLKMMSSNFSEMDTFSEVIEDFELHIICPQEIKEDVIKQIRRLIVNNQFTRYLCKEPIDLDEKLTDKNLGFVGGWDIKNDYVFFIDQKTFKSFIKIVQSYTEVHKIADLLQLK